MTASISLRGAICAHQSSLESPFCFTEFPVPSQVSELCVGGIDFTLVFMILPIKFGTERLECFVLPLIINI
jgi:hypothetical protein